MPRVKPEHSAARRAQILNGAASCFSRAGFHKTSMQDIIAESGLSAGAIYNYFSSKDEIIEAIAHDRHIAEQAALASLDAYEDAGEALKTLGRYFVDELLTKEGRRTRRVGVLAWAEALLNPEIQKSMREGLNTPRQAIADVVKREQQDGAVDSTLNPDAVARAFIAVFYGFVLQKLWDSKTPHKDMLVVFDVFIDAVVARDPKRKTGKRAGRRNQTANP